MKCTLCDKTTFCPYHITEKNSSNEWNTSDLCIPCAVEYLSSVSPPPPQIKTDDTQVAKSSDLTEIKSTEDLLAFITAHQTDQKDPCPKCKMTIQEFDDKGRFGCETCYEHFTEQMEELVYPYHGSRVHLGKCPKFVSDSEEERKKLLRLKMAKAVEMELYEEAGELKKELDAIYDPESPS